MVYSLGENRDEIFGGDRAILCQKGRSYVRIYCLKEFLEIGSDGKPVVSDIKLRAKVNVAKIGFFVREHDRLRSFMMPARNLMSEDPVVVFGVITAGDR